MEKEPQAWGEGDGRSGREEWDVEQMVGGAEDQGIYTKGVAMRTLRRISLAMLVCVGALGGCATTGDLERLKQEFQASIRATKSELQRETTAQVQASRKQVEAQQRELRREILNETEEFRSLSQLTRQTVLELLKLEEASHREGLHSVRSLRRELGGLDGQPK